jgi:hypothetical protein
LEQHLASYVIEGKWLLEKQAETMRHNNSFRLGFTVFIFIAPALVTAQQHGGVALARPLPSVAPTRPMPVAGIPGMVHAPVHSVAPAAPTRSAGHAFGSGGHPTAPRIPGHLVTPKTPIHNHPIQSNYTSAHGSVIPRDILGDDDNGVPGLGFDYPHYAATHPNAGHSQFPGGSVLPIVGGGIYVPATTFAEGGVQSEAAADGQQAETEDAAAEATGNASVDQTPAVLAARPRNNPPSTPASEYIFVRRDGTVFFAVAYSWVNGNLQYVTQDGFRKLVSTTTLDLDATTQFNEQRGVTFHSPA